MLPTLLPLQITGLNRFRYIPTPLTALPTTVATSIRNEGLRNPCEGIVILQLLKTAQMSNSTGIRKTAYPKYAAPRKPQTQAMLARFIGYLA